MVDPWLLCSVADSYLPTKSARPTLRFGLRTAGVIARRERASRHDILSGGIGTVAVGLRYLVRYPTLPVGTWVVRHLGRTGCRSPAETGRRHAKGL